MDAACESIRNSENFKHILEIILAVGNYMNDSSKQANGFRLGTLQRLAFTKDEKNTMTFLHYVEKIVRTSFPEMELFCDELKNAIAVSKLSIDQLRADSNEFMNTIKNCQTSIDIGNLSDSSKFHPKDQVLTYVLASLPEARKKREALNDLLQSTLTEFSKLMKYFGEDPDDSQSVATFFSKFSAFVSEYKKAKKENLQREEENRAYEARKRLAEAPKKAEQLESGALSPTGTKPTKVMDTLLEKLRAAGPSGDARSARRRAAARKSLAEQRRSLSISIPHTELDLDDEEGDNEKGNENGERESSVGVQFQDSPDILPQTPDSSDFAEQRIDDGESDGEDEGSVGSSERSRSADKLVKRTSLGSDSGEPRRLSSAPVSGTDTPTSAINSASASITDDVGGRARQLLQELRSGSTEYGSGRGASPAAGRLAEMRARQAQRRRSSQTHDLSSLSARLSQSSAASSPTLDDGGASMTRGSTPELPEEDGEEERGPREEK